MGKRFNLSEIEANISTSTINLVDCIRGHEDDTARALRKFLSNVITLVSKIEPRPDKVLCELQGARNEIKVDLSSGG